MSLRALCTSELVASTSGRQRTWAVVARSFCTGPERERDEYALPTYEKLDVSPTLIVRKKGVDVIADALYNKGTAFPHAERERLGLRGLLPPRILTLEEQEGRVMQDYREGLDYVSPEEVENWSISRCAVRVVLLGCARFEPSS